MIKWIWILATFAGLIMTVLGFLSAISGAVAAGIGGVEHIVSFTLPGTATAIVGLTLAGVGIFKIGKDRRR